MPPRSIPQLEFPAISRFVYLIPCYATASVVQFKNTSPRCGVPSSNPRGNIFFLEAHYAGGQNSNPGHIIIYNFVEDEREAAELRWVGSVLIILNRRVRCAHGRVARPHSTRKKIRYKYVHVPIKARVEGTFTIPAQKQQITYLKWRGWYHRAPDPPPQRTFPPRAQQSWE